MAYAKHSNAPLAYDNDQGAGTASAEPIQMHLNNQENEVSRLRARMLSICTMPRFMTYLVFQK